MFDLMTREVGLVVMLIVVATIFLSARSRGYKAIQHAKIIDGDSIVIDGKECRLHGLDAPEMPSSEGALARDCLADLMNGYPEIHYIDRGTCPYGRTIVTLYGTATSGREDINASLVAAGYARAYTRYTRKYQMKEITACIRRRGLWQDGWLDHPERTRHSKT